MVSAVNDERYDLTSTQAAARLGVQVATLLRYVSEGHVRCIVLPSGHRRFSRADLEAFIAIRQTS